MAGIGTLTFADPQTGVFGSLGHGICDAETGVLLPLSEGDLIYSTVETVTRGKSGAPGALQGDFSDARPIGTVTKNTVHGIFGTLSDLSLLSGQGALPVAARDEIQTGDAEIIANIDGDKVQRYSVQIVRLYPENDEYGRGMMLHVTDKTLLAQTGGILQGMSGSPVVQNGRLIGAVTHHWDEYYAKRIQAVLDGTWKTAPMWGGAELHMVRLSGITPKAPKAVVDDINATYAKMEKQAFNVFTGPIVDNTGKTVIPAGSAADDKHLLTMNYFVKGVLGKVPSNQ